MGKVSRQTRDAVLRAVSQRYAAASRPERVRILDEFTAITGHHRKHAIRLLNRGAVLPNRVRGTRERTYDDAVSEALRVLWETSDRICGKRLKPLLPLLIEALERHGHLKLDESVRERLLRVSPATIDRLLAPTRSAVRAARTARRRPPAARGSVPVRTFGDWKDPAPGFMEIDLVAHSGPSVGGSFVHTLTLTDIASGWTECIALAVRDATLVTDALRRLRAAMPFPLRGIDTDNGSEFINQTLLDFCTHEGVEFTRSRPYRKNDQAWVEQKNGSVVRRMVGYGRLEGIAAAEALARLYGSSRLFVNFFQPSFKLLEKTRVGARVSKRYQTPETPAARLLGSDIIEEPMKQKIRAVMVTLDPLRLLDEIRTVQHHLASLAAGEHVHVVPHPDADLDRFLGSLAAAWRGGEVRPTHQRRPKPERHWRTREDPFADVWPSVLLWLETEPDRTAKELFKRLQAENPAVFPDCQLRTLQRRVKDWRRAAARRLVFAEVGGEGRTPVPVL